MSETRGRTWREAMGYFVRKLRRSVSAAQKSALGVVRVSEEWLAAPVKAPVGEKYLRLETRVRDEDSKELAGVFVTAYELHQVAAIPR